MMPEPTDQELLARMSAGPREAARDALRVLYHRHAGVVLSFITRLVSDLNDADDLLQETFLSAARNAGSFRRGSARPWLLAIAASRLKTERRARRRRSIREQGAARNDRIEAAPTLRDPELEAQLGELPANERAALDLRFHAGLEHAEVARVLGVSLRTAKSWSARGLERLRSRLGAEEESR